MVGSPNRDKRKLRVINQNTTYDVPACMKRLARRIEKGELGCVTDVVICVRRTDDMSTTGYHFGNGHVSIAMMMLDKVKAQIT